MSGPIVPGTETITAMRCTCFCGHRWIADSYPKRCARCKSRKWADPDHVPVVHHKKRIERSDRSQQTPDPELDQFADVPPVLPPVLGTAQVPNPGIKPSLTALNSLNSLDQIQRALSQMSAKTSATHAATCSCYVCRPPKESREPKEPKP